MVGLQVPPQFVVELVYGPALHAGVRLLLMGLFVLQELAALLELLTALRAFVCSVRVVRLHMDVERVFPRERLLADRAHEAFVARVLG